MAVSVSVRRLGLATHLITSIGWLGAVVAFLALAIAGVSSANAALVRAAYVSMHLLTWFVIVPFGFAALATGIVQSVITPWGLLRHYWIVAKLLMTLAATMVLLLHTQPVNHVASVALMGELSSSELRDVRIQLIGDAAGGLFVLLLITLVSIFKPWGLTPIGLRWQDAAPRRDRAEAIGRWGLIGLAVFIALILVLHLFGYGMHAH